jgi:hypothetical protein
MMSWKRRSKRSVSSKVHQRPFYLTSPGLCLDPFRLIACDPDRSDPTSVVDVFQRVPHQSDEIQG